MTKAVLSKAARSPEELFPLIEYCRAGNLKAVSEWIAAGHPIDPPQTGKRTRRRFPLEIAIEKGFLTLVETLLDGGSKPEANGGVLSLAVQHREVAIAKLLLERGASADSVWPDDIFDGGPEMLNLFIEHGFDPTTDLAYYHALCSHVHPLLSVLKDYKERFPDLHRQAEMALCHYCEKGNLRAVSLLVWAGARPNARVIKPEHSDDPEMATSPLEEAALAGRLDILKRLKPQDFPEELKTLMDSVWLLDSGAIAEFLGTVPLNESVEHAYDFRDGVPCWYFALRPKTDWKTSLSAIEAELAQPCLAERLGISADAAKLIEWIESLRHDELLGCYTPIVEDECERRIGIESPWDDDENFPAYLQMLVDEINEKTDYRLRVQPWKRYASFKSRIRVGREKPDLDDVLQRLRSIAWARGITLDAARTRNTLERLIGGESEKPHPS
jgi:hypothetical protein